MCVSVCVSVCVSRCVCVGGGGLQAERWIEAGGAAVRQLGHAPAHAAPVYYFMQPAALVRGLANTAVL